MRVGYQKRTKTGDKTIHLPVPEGVDYDTWIENAVTYRQYLTEQIEQHPELFPADIDQGWCLCGFVVSKRQQMKTRRIVLKNGRQTYQIHPDTVMPFMVGKTEDVEKALYLRTQGVSYEALSYVFGKNPMYWYNLNQAIGRISIVGSTVKVPANMPVDLVADEKHCWRLGERIYIAVTVGMGCFLGAEIASTAGTKDLRGAYGKFVEEFHEHCPGVELQSVNVDGWDATCEKSGCASSDSGQIE